VQGSASVSDASATRARAFRDITQGDLNHHIWRLSGPIILSQALTMFPSLYDAIWLGRLGSDAQAAAGIAMSVRMTMISILMGLSSGGGAMVARYVGAKDRDRADSAALQAVLLMVVASSILGGLGVIFARPLMILGGASAAVLPLAIRYARVLFAGLIAMEMVPSVGGMLSAAGDPWLTLNMVILSTGSLVVAEPLLVRWMGIEGAALALIGSNAIAMFWGLGLLLTGRTAVRINLHRLRVDVPMMGRILRIALPAIVQRGTPNLAMTVLTRLVSGCGDATLAAWVVTRRVLDFVTIPGMGLSRVAPAFVGQNLGAEKPERAVRAMAFIARMALIISALALGLAALLAPWLMRLFTHEQETIASGAYILRVLAVGYLAMTLSYVFDAAQAGAGDTLSPMVINMIALWVVQVPLAFVLARVAHLGAPGIWAALSLGWICQVTLMWLRFRQGRWKLKRI
jgi:putative MATE family efflux protein